MRKLLPNSQIRAGAVVLGIVFVGIGFYWSSSRPATPTIRAAKAKPITTPRTTKEARELETKIAKMAKSRDPKVQDQVGQARIMLAYHAVHQGNFKLARKKLIDTVKTYKGTGAMSAAFGGIKDQAAYQAAACLNAEGKTKEARAEFERFMRDYPYSPLVHATYKRLVAMNGGESTTAYENLLQAAIAKQEAKIKFETSTCGPKSLAFLLDQIGTPHPDYQALAKICGTGDSGTTIEGMIKGLKSVGKDGYAYRLNRQDLVRAKLPAILLERDHYLVLLKVEGDRATVYDSRYRQNAAYPLPPLDNPDFAINAIVLAPLSDTSSLDKS